LLTLKNPLAEYPRQFGILVGGSLINSIGSGMVFPFLTLYLSQRLNLSLTVVGAVLSLWSASALVGQIAGGSLADQLGRKPLMAISLCLNAIGILAFGLADSLTVAAVIVVCNGITGALFQPARDAMIADLVATEKRAAAYALLRVVHNVGVAIGPALGGFLAARSYLIVFGANALGTFIFFLFTLALIGETKPVAASAAQTAAPAGSFRDVLRDYRFLAFCLGAMFVIVSAAQMFTTLPVYMKKQFALGESYYGWVMTTNATMVVLLQYSITRAGSRLARLPFSALGAIFYGLGTASVVLGSAFPHFVLAMAIATIGEMIVVPTATAVTADLAPADMRGRYMGMLGLTWSLGYGIGPIFGGIITDQIAPRALWLPAGSAALLGAAVFLLLARLTRPPTDDH
jgi:MFS family permease